MHYATAAPDPDRMMKATAFHTQHVTVIHGCDGEGAGEKERKKNKAKIHTATVEEHLQTIPIHTLLNTKPPAVHRSEETLPRSSRRTLAQLRAQKCPLLRVYLHHIAVAEDPSCPLCGHNEHNTAHIFACPQIPTELTPQDLWHNPVQVAQLIEVWEAALNAEN